MRFLLFASILLSLVSFGWAQETRIFTNAEGKQIQATITKATESEVVLKVGTKSYTVPINSLSPEDQVYIAKFREDAAKNFIPRIDVEYKSNRTTVARPSDDDITQKVVPSAIINNEELDFAIDGAKVTIVTFGKVVDRDNVVRVLSHESFDLSVGAQDSATVTGNPYLVTYDQQSSYRHGYRYDGHILVIQNATGKVIHVDATNKYDKYGEKALTLKKGQDLDRNLNPVL